jgi:hypothetical protein
MSKRSKSKSKDKRKKNKPHLLTEPLIEFCTIRTAWPEESLEKGDEVVINTRKKVSTGDLAALRFKDHFVISRVYFHGNTVRVVGRTGRMTVHKQSKVQVIGKVVSHSRPEPTTPLSDDARQTRITELRRMIQDTEGFQAHLLEEVGQLEREADHEWSTQN